MTEKSSLSSSGISAATTYETAPRLHDSCDPGCGTCPHDAERHGCRALCVMKAWCRSMLWTAVRLHKTNSCVEAVEDAEVLSDLAKAEARSSQESFETDQSDQECEENRWQCRAEGFRSFPRKEESWSWQAGRTHSSMQLWQWKRCRKLLRFFFRPSPFGFRQVDQHTSA